MYIQLLVTQNNYTSWVTTILILHVITYYKASNKQFSN